MFHILGILPLGLITVLGEIASDGTALQAKL